jgi:hypothetical protein
MKIYVNLTFAFLLVAVLTLAPTTSYESGKQHAHHQRSQTYHDRGPRVHTHGSHPHHR